MSTTISPLKRGTKRAFIECERSPTKKRKTLLHLDAIRKVKQAFSIDKLQNDAELTHKAADDKLFNKQPSSKESQYMRWVIACKFIIASGLRLDSYDVLGMNRTKIPQNMYFYVDHQNNLCALIHDEEYNVNTRNIMDHCNKLETSMIQTYYGMHENARYIQGYIDQDVDEDNDLCIDLKRKRNDDIVCIIRIPMSYYSSNMDSSFYALCCRIARHLLCTQEYFNHPLFQLLLQNIANFDCFEMSVPMVPLYGSLYSMFCEFGCGAYHVRDIDIDVTLNKREFTAFLGTYDCWREMERNKQCRNAIRQCWLNAIDTDNDINIMKLVIEFSDFHFMSDERVLHYVNQFDAKSTKYASYFDELKSQINRLETIII